MPRNNQKISDHPHDDISKILDFLTNIRKDLDDFLERYNLLIPEYPELETLFSKAWKDLEPSFIDASEYLKSKRPLSKLTKVGLTGPQLSLKLAVVDLARRESNIAEKEYRDALSSQKEEKRSWWRRLFGILLEHGDTILGSLGAAGIPGTDAISEFKEVAEKILRKFRKQ